MLKEKKKNKVKSVWKNGELKIVFAEPSIQAHGGVVFAESARDILYYYYTVEVFKNPAAGRVLREGESLLSFLFF